MPIAPITDCPLTREQLQKFVDRYGDDGHSIFAADRVAKHLGVDIAVLKPFIRDHVSAAADPKFQITRGDGSPAEHMVGIYGLTMLESLCKMLKLVPDDKIGRGWRARAATEQLKKYIKDTEPALAQ